MTPTQYRRIRRQLGLTQAALAERLGVTRKTIIQREGKGPVTSEAALALQSITQTKPNNDN
jgi:DNA-binding XRE family transcriptional regulator